MKSNQKLRTRCGWNLEPFEKFALALILTAMVALFFWALPHMDLDRRSEDAYMRPPYEAIQHGHLSIDTRDPYAENGPQALLVSAAIAYYGRSLLPMRIYHFAYSLILMSIFFTYFCNRTRAADLLQSSATDRKFELSLFAVLFFCVWLMIRMSFGYTIQFNGMTPGLICVLLGLWFFEQRQWNAAILALGVAYSFKGQFLAFLPGLAIYALWIDQPPMGLKATIKKGLLLLFLYFFPTTLVLGTLWGLLGAYYDINNWLRFAFNGEYILWQQLSHALHISGDSALVLAQDRLQGQRTRAIEYAGFGRLDWVLIGFSISFAVVQIVRAIRLRLRLRLSAGTSGVSSDGAGLSPHTPLFAFGFMVLPYWVNYLFFWGYPFYYNMLPALLFNVIGIPFFVYYLMQWSDQLTRSRTVRRAILLASVTAYIGLSVRFLHADSSWNPHHIGNALIPFEWMR